MTSASYDPVADPMTFDLETYRQQVETIRARGGATWLSILNEMHSATPPSDPATPRRAATRARNKKVSLVLGHRKETLGFSEKKNWC